MAMSASEAGYLLRSPANARRLQASVARVEAGDYEGHELITGAEAGEQQAS
jgi:antitoxin YefM